jgi:hypothetical protein
MKKTADPEWIRWFQRNLAFICKLEEALSPESFLQVCSSVNEYRRKKRQHGYRLQDREEIEKQILPLLVALDQEFLCDFMDILDKDVPKKSSMPSGSNDINAMDDANVEFKPEKSGHLSTNRNSSGRIQLKSADEVVLRHEGVITDGKSGGLEDVLLLNPDGPSQPRRRRIKRPPVAPITSSGSRHGDIAEKSGHLSTNRNSSDRIQLKSADEVVLRRDGVITDGKSGGLEDVLLLNPDGPRQPRFRRIKRPPVAPIMSSGSRRDDIVADVSLESKKRKDCDKQKQRVRQDEHKVHGEHVRQPGGKKCLDHVTTKRQLVSEGTDCTPIHSSAMNGDNSRILRSEDHHQPHEHHDDKRMRVHPQCMQRSSVDFRKATAAFLVNLSKVGDWTLQESVKSLLRLFFDKKLPSYYANKCICMLLEAHKKLLDEFCELVGFQWLPEGSMRSYNGGRRGFRDLAFKQYTYIEDAARNDKLCSLEKYVPLSEFGNVGEDIWKTTISLEIQLHEDLLEEKQFSDNIKEKLRGYRHYRWWPGCRYENVTPNIGLEFQVTPKKIPPNPHNRNDHVVKPNLSFKCQASAVQFLAHPHNSVRKLESDFSRLWLEIGRFDIALSDVERMLSELQEHPSNRSCNS